MNKFVKKLMAFGLSVGMLAGIGFGFAGCGRTPDNSNEPNTPPIVDPSYDDPDKGEEPDIQNPSDDPTKEPDTPVTPPVTEKKTFEEAKTDFSAFVTSMKTGKNFTYTETDRKVEFDGDKVKMDYSGDVTYLKQENGESFVYELQTDNFWHKDLAEDGVSIDKMISSATSSFDNVKWQSFKTDAHTLSGVVEKKLNQYATSRSQVEAELVDDNGEVSWKITIDNEKEVEFSKIGKTTVTLPENVKGETVESENIFTTQNGQIVWNVKAIKDVLEPWLKNEMTDASGNHVDNQFGRPVFARVNDNKVREIIFVNPAKDKLEFGYILDNPEGNSFEARHIWGWDNFSANKQSLTKDEFIQFLNTREERDLLSTISKINLEYTTLDQDYATAHKQEFETLTKKVLQRQQELSGAKVLFGFSTRLSQDSLSNLGYGKMWTQGYLLKVGDQLKFVNIRLYSLNSGLGPIENVISGKESDWWVDDFSSYDVSKDNAKLYEYSAIGTNLNKE